MEMIDSGVAVPVLFIADSDEWHHAIAFRSPFVKRICWTVLAWNTLPGYCAVQNTGNGRRKKDMTRTLLEEGVR